MFIYILSEINHGMLLAWVQWHHWIQLPPCCESIHLINHSFIHSVGQSFCQFTQSSYQLSGMEYTNLIWSTTTAMCLDKSHNHFALSLCITQTYSAYATAFLVICIHFCEHDMLLQSIYMFHVLFTAQETISDWDPKQSQS